MTTRGKLKINLTFIPIAALGLSVNLGHIACIIRGINTRSTESTRSSFIRLNERDRAGYHRLNVKIEEWHHSLHVASQTSMPNHSGTSVPWICTGIG